MSRLSCLLLVLTLMACSAASPEKKIQEAKMMASTDESMARGSLFGIGSLIQQKIKNKKKLITSIIGKKKGIKSKGSLFGFQKKGIQSKGSLFGIGSQSLFGIGSLIKQKIQSKKKLIQQKIQNKKNFVTIIGKKKGIKNRRAVLDSAESPKENIDVENMLTNVDASKTRGSLFGIGSLIQQKIQNKKNVISSIIGKKKGFKSKGLLFGIGSQPLFGIGSLIKQKIQNKKKFVSTIIGKKKSIKNKREVLDTAESPKEDIDEAKMLTNVNASKTRGSFFGIGALIQQKIQNKKELFSTIVAKKKSIKNKILNKKTGVLFQ